MCRIVFIMFKQNFVVTMNIPVEMVRLLRFWLDQFFSKSKNKSPFLQEATKRKVLV